MRTAYKVLAYLIALEVVVQAAMIAFAVFGLVRWVDGGGVLDAAAIEDESLTFTGVLGFPVHAINGMMLIPLLALLLLVVSFFAKVPRGVVRAAVVLGLVVLQVVLGIYGHSTPYAGLLHGANALLVMGAAIEAGRLAGRPAVSRSVEPARVSA